MAGLEPTPPPPSVPIPLGRRSSAPPGPGSLPPDSGGGRDVESLLALGADPAPAKAAAPPVRTPAPRKRDETRQLPTGPRLVRRTRDTPPARTRKGGSAWLAVLAALVVAGGVFAVLELRPHPPTGEAIAPEPPPSAAAVQAPACRATLVLTDVPQKAEVLMHAGQAPVDVEKMPVGTRLEFVATAEGYAPKRVVVPAGATWDRGADGKPRFETAVQLDRSTAKGGGNDPWPPVEMGSEVGGLGPPGTVHVVATPHGAEIWILAGMGPEARIEQLPCDRDLDLLVAGPSTFRKRVRVTAGDFAADAAAAPSAKAITRTARVSAR